MTALASLERAPPCRRSAVLSCSPGAARAALPRWQAGSWAAHGSRGGSLASPCNPANARSSLAFSRQGHGVSRPSNPFLFSITFSWARWLVGSWAQSFWRRGGDSNLPSLEASRPEGAAFQGKLRFPGRVPRLALQPCERSLFARVLEAGPRRVPPFESLLVFYYLLVGSWARGLVGSIFLAERGGFEPTFPRSLAPRGRCVSREATVPGAGPLPRFLRRVAKQLAPAP